MEITYTCSVKGKSQNISSENKVEKLKSLKSKMVNPFWIPSNGADLFLIKQIYKEDRKKQKETNLSSTRRPSYKFNVPTTNLTMKKLKAFTSTYLTEQAKMNSTVDTKLECEKNSFGSCNPTKVLEHLSKKRTNSMPVSPKANEAMLNKKISGMEAPHFGSIKDYILKTRQFLLMKHQSQIKNECILRLEETYKNEMESIKDSMISMKVAKELFEEDFYKKYQKYMKFLAVEKEKEKKTLNNLLDEKSSHDADIKKFENRINKLKDKLEQYNEYKLFLICIKEKKLLFSKNTKTISTSYGTIPKETIQSHSLNHTAKDNFYITSSNLKNMKMMLNSKSKFNKGKGTASDKSHTIDEDDEKSKLMNHYDYEKVFTRHEELINEMKRMEVKNLELLSEVNELEQVVEEKSKEMKKVENEDKSGNKYIINETKRKEEELVEIREKNKKLKEEKEKLNKNKHHVNSSQNDKVHSLTKNRVFKTQIYSRIMILFKKCCELNIFEKENWSEMNKKNHSNNDNQLEMMRLIEKTFQYLSKKYFSYDQHYSEDLKMFEKDLEAERKRQLALEQAKENEKKTENLIQKIVDKYNKIVIKSNKKIVEHSRPLEKKKNLKISNKNQNEPNLLDLLHYEGDDNNY
jgi:hypothetical protein